MHQARLRLGHRTDAEGRQAKGDRERAATVKGHVNAMIDGLRDGGFQNLQTDRLSLEAPVPNLVQYQLTAQRPDGSPAFIRTTTVFGKSTYSIQVIAATQDEATNLSRVIDTPQELTPRKAAGLDQTRPVFDLFNLKTGAARLIPQNLPIERMLS